MIDDLLNLARLDRHQMVLKMTPLNALVENVIADLESETGGRKIQWEVGRLPSVSCDTGLMRQVFASLLSNAVKYTNAGGQIEVSLEAGTTQAALRVKDSGVGISAEMLPRVFDAYVRGDHGTRGRGSGLGLGLSLARELTQLHGGALTAHSDGVGKGSEFVVRLPAASPL